MSTDPRKDQEANLEKMSDKDLDSVAGGIDSVRLPIDGRDPTSPDPHHGNMPVD